MTHDELLAKINYDIQGNPYDEYMSALRTVVELHKPVQSYMFEEEACSHCSSEEDRVEILYPCQTIQAIKKELNGY